MVTARQSILSTVIVLLLIMPGCCGSYDSATRAKDEDARRWLHYWTQPYNWTKISEWRGVTESRTQEAEMLLQAKDSIQVTAEEAHNLTGTSNTADQMHGTPYLLRGVGDAVGKWPQEIYITENSEVWVGGGANSRCPVAMRRRPVVVWMGSPPKDLYVTFVVAK